MFWDLQPINIACNTRGIIISGNIRADNYGLKVGSMLQTYLHDVRNQRAWMQILAEINQDIIFDKPFSLRIMVGDMRIALECYLRNSDTLGRIVVAQGIPIDQTSFDRDGFDSGALERKFCYEMSFLNSSDNAVIATDENYRVIFFNEAAERIYGYTANEVPTCLVCKAALADLIDFGEECWRVFES